MLTTRIYRLNKTPIIMKKLLMILGFLFLSFSLYSQEEVYTQDEVTGIITFQKWCEDGNLIEIGKYNSNKKPHGLWKKFDSKGNVIVIAKFRNGKKHGTWKHWNREANQYAEVVYKNGIRIRSILIEEQYNTSIALN